MYIFFNNNNKNVFIWVFEKLYYSKIDTKTLCGCRGGSESGSTQWMEGGCTEKIKVVQWDGEGEGYGVNELNQKVATRI